MDSSGLEEHEPVLFEDRHLTEGLPSAVLRLVLISLLEEAGLVRQRQTVGACLSAPTGCRAASDWRPWVEGMY